nr:Gfo/Idh/MocA family oxidoreductase [Tessaracoccus coleopterorum]
MNGVSGRMGYRQHLVRSILAIREAGGVELPDGTKVTVRPLLVGRSEAKLAEIAERHGIVDYTTDLDAALADPQWEIYADFLVTKARAAALRKAIAAGKTIYTEKPTAESVEEALELAQLAREAGVKTGVVHDKLYLPGLQKLRRLIDSGFFGRILSVRGEFGYWVFEGDWQPAQRPSWNYRAEDGGGIIVDMFPHWNYLLENLFGPCVPSTRRRRSTSRGAGTRRARSTRPRPRTRPTACSSSRAGRRPDQLELDHPRQPRRASGVPRRRHARLGGGRPVRRQAAGPQPDAEAGVEPGPGRRARLRRRLGAGADQRPVPQRLPAAVGGVPRLLRAGHRLPVRPARRCARRPARGGRARLGPRRPQGDPRRADAGLIRMSSTVTLLDAAGSTRRVDLLDPPAIARPTGPLRTRTAYAAAHVVPVAWADNTPGRPAEIDWDATLAFRRHVYSWGLGVADAMDTAQRNMGSTQPRPAS